MHLVLKVGTKQRKVSTDPTVQLVGRLVAGDRRALSRAITALEADSEPGRALLRALQPHLGNALVVGFTGPPGAGKSTLVNAYIAALRDGGQSVGVIAVDPSSPISGGAILGDRLRMGQHSGDDEVFIRSLASRGHLGGLSPAAARIVDAMDAAGKDVVVIETVGTGQSEIEIAEVADLKVVVLAPGLGDDIQAMKAGILEIADLLVVNKADLPAALATAQQLKSALALKAEGRDTPVLQTVATTGKGVAALAEALEARGTGLTAEARRARRRARIRRALATAAAALVRDTALAADDSEIEKLCRAVAEGDLDLAGAARRAVKRSAKTLD